MFFPVWLQFQWHLWKLCKLLSLSPVLDLTPSEPPLLETKASAFKIPFISSKCSPRAVDGCLFAFWNHAYAECDKRQQKTYTPYSARRCLAKADHPWHESENTLHDSMSPCILLFGRSLMLSVLDASLHLRPKSSDQSFTLTSLPASLKSWNHQNSSAFCMLLLSVMSWSLCDMAKAVHMRNVCIRPEFLIVST